MVLLPPDSLSQVCEGALSPLGPQLAGPGSGCTLLGCLEGRLLSCTGGRRSGQLLIQTVSVCSVHCSDLGVNTAGSVGGGSLPAWLAGQGSGRGISGEFRVLPKCKQQVRLCEGRVQVGLAEEHRAQSSVEEMPLPWLPVPDLVVCPPPSFGCSVHLGLFLTNTAYFTYGGMCFRVFDVLPWGCPTSLCVDLEAQRTGLLLEGGTAPGSLRFSLTR